MTLELVLPLPSPKCLFWPESVVLSPKKFMGMNMYMQDWWILGMNGYHSLLCSCSVLFLIPVSLVAVTLGSTDSGCISKSWCLAERCLETDTNCIPLPEVLQLKFQHFIWIQVTYSTPSMHVWHHLLWPNSKAFNQGFLRYLGIFILFFSFSPYLRWL